MIKLDLFIMYCKILCFKSTMEFCFMFNI